MMRTMLFLIFAGIMIASCSKGHNEKATNDESFMKGQFVPLHHPKPKN